MIKFLHEKDKNFYKEFNAALYFPNNISGHFALNNYNFSVGSSYNSFTENDDTGVMLEVGYEYDPDYLSEDQKEKDEPYSFFLSPDDAAKLGNALLEAAEHAYDMNIIKLDRQLSRLRLSNLINFEQVDHVSISVVSKNNCRKKVSEYADKLSDQDKQNKKQTDFLYDIIVKTFVKAEKESNIIKSKFNNNASFSFELNLYKFLYTYAMNMIKHNLVQSKHVLPSNMKNGKTVSYFDVLKQNILMNIIRGIYIDLHNYPNKELDELFIFEQEKELLSEMDKNIEIILDIIKDDFEQIMNLDNKHLMGVVPIKINDSTDNNHDDDNDI